MAIASESSKLYRRSLLLGSRICHQRNERSFYKNGRKFPVCARCSGIYLALIPGILTSVFLPFPLWFYLLLASPLVLDGTIQLFTKYRSTNRRRLATGLLFGFAYGGLMVLVFRWLLGLML